MRRFAPALLLVLLAGAGVLTFKQTRPVPEPAERALFRTLVPDWTLDRARDSAPLLSRNAMLEAAKPWPTVAEKLAALDATVDSEEKSKAAAEALNQALHAAALPYFVDPQQVNGRAVFLTYDLLGTSRWKLGDRTVEVVRVRRLDNLNVELEFLGHASGARPIVLVDRLEARLIHELGDAYAGEPHGNEMDKAARSLWRSILEKSAGPAIAIGAEQLARRSALMLETEQRMASKNIRLARPERFVLGPRYFETLEPYTDLKRRGGPLFLAADLRDLRRADRALEDGEGRKALDAVLSLEADATEAHEARHALEPEELPPPQKLVDTVGDDDPAFAQMAERELRAYLGELHDASVPPCLVLTRLGMIVAGEDARSTPHWYAGHVLFEGLGDVEHPVETLKTLCAAPEAEVRQKVAALATSLYGKPFVSATREAAP